VTFTIEIILPELEEVNRLFTDSDLIFPGIPYP
jgi:hypothetical protein